MKGLHMAAWILLIVGGLNWLLIGAVDWSIESILGSGLSRLVFILVGLSAVYELFTHKKNCKQCGSSATPSM